MFAKRLAALSATILSTWLMPTAVMAQQDPGVTEEEEIVVTGEIRYRNRTDTVAPELVYDQEFFENFEPLSVGDQLSRVPGVAFTSDIGERDAPQMRGLGEGFTQVLVNGRPIPGAGNDRSVFVDRIPAEIVDRVEIVRSPGANIDSQGIGGTINIILKDGMSLPPGVIARVGTLYDVDNEELRPLGAVSFSGRTDDRNVAWSATFDYQQRYNVKVLDQQLFDDTSPGFDPDQDGRNLFQPDAFNPAAPSTAAIEHQDQIDTRDSRDISFNGDLTFALGGDNTLRADVFYLNTNREESENGINYFRADDSGDDPGTGDDNGNVANDPWDINETFRQTQDITQDSYGLSMLYEGVLSPSWSVESQFRYARFLEDNVEDDFSTAVFDGDPEEGERTSIDTDDQEISLDGALTFDSDAFAQSMGLANFEFEVGAAWKNKTRDLAQRIFEDDNDLDFADPGEEVLAPGTSGTFNFEERRFDVYAMTELGFTPALTVQLGVRVENTDTETSTALLSGSSDSQEINPSAHVQWNITESGQIRASYARTVRRPSIDQLVPFADEETPGDDDETVGNPDLGIESAWGYDIGYEHRLGRRGIIGVNYFHRDVSDLISLVNTGAVSGGGGFIYTFDNIGDGEVSGWELDVSTPLEFIGLPETGFFANYTDLDSSRVEPFTGIEATFNAQPDYVYNWGITHNVPSWNSSFGFSYRKQGLSVSTFLGEIENQWYDGNLEVFVEHRFTDHLVMRLVGNNILDADSIQAEKNYDGDTAIELRDAMILNDVDEFEVERENSSPTVMLTLRAVF
jgi:TonB-dependent receptor